MLVYSCPSIAGKCDWATNTPADDSKYKYLVAKSYSDVSASDAATKAEQDIDGQIGRLFGTALNVQSEFYSDEKTAAGSTRSYERSIGTISLKGLERQKNDVGRESGGWVGCVQYRYSQKEFKQEKERLEKLPATEVANIDFNESAGDTTCRGGVVEIITTPSNAYVTIDNGKYQGNSPIKFINVCNGSHTLEITKENYVDVEERLIVPTSGKITKTLKKASKNITIRTALGNSKILINGVDYGREPVRFNAIYGDEYKITTKNSEAVDITRTLTFSKYSENEYTINMEKLPGKIDFSAFKKRNPGVEISVDGKKVSGNTTGELSSNKSHDIVFSKKSFFDIEKSVSIKGGETYYYPSKELTFSKYPERNYGMLIGFGLGGGKIGKDSVFNLTLASVSVTAEFHNFFYLEGGLSLDYSGYSDSDYAYKVRKQNEFYGFSDASIFDLLYFNAGIKLNRHIIVFGSMSIGVFDANSVFYIPSNYGGHYEEEKSLSKTMVRTGFGLQYEGFVDEKKDVLVGLRFVYLTGKYDFKEFGIPVKGSADTYKLVIYARGGFDLK